MTEGRSGRSLGWWGLVLVAMAVTAMVGGTIWAASRGDDPTAEPRAAAPSTSAPPGGANAVDPPGALEEDRTVGPFDDLAVQPGDLVSASGLILETPEGLVVCERGGFALYVPGPEPPPECTPMAVPLLGVEGADLPGWTVRDGVWFVDGSSTVKGRWSAEGIVVDRVVAGGPDDFPTPVDHWVVPCVPPDDGWGPDRGFVDIERERVETEAVRRIVDGARDRFHSMWIGYPDGDPAGPSVSVDEFGAPIYAHLVLMVSTVDDPAAVQAELDAVHSGNLCVVQVERSGAQLDAVVNRLSTGDGPWEADAGGLTQSILNRAVLQLPVLDLAAIERIGPDADLLEIDPFVRPA